MLRNLVLVIVMVLAGGAGFWAGQWSGSDARKKLAEAEQRSKDLVAAHEKASDELKTKLATLTSDYERDKRVQEEQHQQVRSEAEALVAGSKTQVATLSKERDSKLTELQRLRADLAAAKTPQEKQVITERIVVKEVEVKTQEARIASETCVATAVPAPLLAKWQSVQAAVTP